MSRLAPEEKIRRRLARYPEAIRLAEAGEARPEVVEALRLLRAGLTGVQIAQAMGVSKSHAFELLTDPTGEKTVARKHKRHGNCVDCGVPTYNGGARDVPKRCLRCERERNAEENERIFALWDAGLPGTQIAAELGLDYNQVRGRVENARRRNGRALLLHRHRNREKWPALKALWEAGVPIDGIATQLGITKHNAYFQISSMRERGVAVSTEVRRQRQREKVA